MGFRFTKVAALDSAFVIFTHDCEECIYVGKVSTEERGAHGDLYVCPMQSTIVLRDGENRWDNESGIYLMLEPAIAIAIGKAMLAGKVPPFRTMQGGN